MESYTVAIPSYQRAGKQGTLEYLAALGVPKDRIYIFVQTEDDRDAYQQHAGQANIVYAAADGIAKARNNILRHFGGAKNVLMMDDDISAIGILRRGQLADIQSREELAENINRCFKVAQKHRAQVFGLYPVYNAFFMSRTISTAVTVNTVVGFCAGFDMRMNETYKAKEDIELCARILNSGGSVFRYNFLAVKAKHRTNAGGCCDTWKSDENRKAAQRLCRTYPAILAPHARKPDEVRVIAKDDRKIDLDKRGGSR